MSSTLSSAPSSTGSPSASPTGQSQNSGGPSSPLLFFVALGFGVVFTNLWIIVGVKYCFRYNQRNRARLAGEDPDAVDLTAIPRVRRRREKKLMTMDEVNEKFPLIKYKTWRSTRAEEGLPTAGGINPAASRPASVKNLSRVSEDEDTSAIRQSASDAIREKLSPSEPNSPIATRHVVSNTAETSKEPSTTATITPVSETVTAQQDINQTDSHDDGDQIQTAIPTEQLPDPGDTCAICIDVLEDDDDVRGLVCGHAFHASCVDPWLTGRRACCPLCKADYYIPKPRPDGETEDAQTRNLREQQLRGNRPSSGASSGPMAILNRFLPNPTIRPANRNAATSTRHAQPRSQPQPTNSTSSPEISSQQQTWRTRLNLPRIPPLTRLRGNATNEVVQAPPQSPSPRQLEAGNSR